MVNFGSPTAEICWQVCGTPANFNVLNHWWFFVINIISDVTVFLVINATILQQEKHQNMEKHHQKASIKLNFS